MSIVISETIVRKYWNAIWQRYIEERRQYSEITFQAFLQKILEIHSTEIELRAFLHIKGGTIADIPHLLQEYSDKNLDPPNVVSFGYARSVWWKCSKDECGHEWMNSPSNRMRKGNGCPGCSGRVPTSSYNLATEYPHLIEEYSPRNTLSPAAFTPHSRKKVWWISSKCGHEWEAPVMQRVAGNGCPVCHYKVPDATNNMTVTHPHLVGEYSSKNSIPADHVVATKTTTICWWICSKCGYEWRTRVSNRAKGQGCPACCKPPRVLTSKNNLAVTHPDLAKEYSAKNALPADKVFAGTSKKLWWKCPKCQLEYQAIGGNRVTGYGCPGCGHKRATEIQNLAVTHPHLVEEYSAKNELLVTEILAGSQRKVWWQCRVCGWEWQAVCGSRASGVGCPACSNRIATPLNNLAVTHPYLVAEYSERNTLPVTEVIAGTNKRLWWRCGKQECGYEWEASGNNRSQGTGCPACVGKAVTEKNNLAVMVPLLVEEYSEENTLPADKVYYSTDKKLKWRCRVCDHRYEMSGYRRTRKNGGCPACCNQVVAAHNNLLALRPDLAEEYSDRNTLPADKIIASTDKKLWWRCRTCNYEWQTTGRRRIERGSGCPVCRGRVPTQDRNLTVTHPHLAEEYSPKNRLPAREILAGSHHKVWWLCKVCGWEWQAVCGSRASGVGCPACANKVVTGKNNLLAARPDLAVQYSADNKQSADQVYIGSKKEVWWSCLECSYKWEGTVLSRSRAKDTRCPVCRGEVVSEKNNLAAVNPVLAAEYAHRNTIPADKVWFATTTKLWWTCKICQCEWQVSGHSRVFGGKGCPICEKKSTGTSLKGRKVLIAEDSSLAVTHPLLAEEYSEKNALPSNRFYGGSGQKVWWLCKVCGWEWQASPNNRAQHHSGCPACSGRAATADNNLAVVYPALAEQYSARNIVPSVNLKPGSGQKVWWLCKVCGWEWQAAVCHRVGGAGCPACYGRVATAKNNLAVTHPHLAAEYSKNNSIPADRIKAGTGLIVLWECSKCGYEWKAKGDTRVRQGSGCPACSHRVLTKNNNLAVTHPHLAAEYSDRNEKPATEVVAGTNKKLWWKCLKCGYEWQAGGNNRVKGSGCRRCAREKTKTNFVRSNK